MLKNCVRNKYAKIKRFQFFQRHNSAQNKFMDLEYNQMIHEKTWFCFRTRTEEEQTPQSANFQLNFNQEHQRRYTAASTLSLFLPSQLKPLIQHVPELWRRPLLSL